MPPARRWLAVIVGHRRVRSQADVPEEVYVRRPDEAQSWLAQGSLAADADAAQWLDRALLNIPADKIAAVVVDDDALMFERKDGTFALRQPADHPPLDNYKVEDVSRALENLTLMSVKADADAPVAADARHATFLTADGLAVKATVFHADKDIWARFSAGGDNKAEADKLNARLAGWTFQLAGMEGEVAGADAGRPEGCRTGDTGCPRACCRRRRATPKPLRRQRREVTDREYPTRPFVGIGIVVHQGRPRAAVPARQTAEYRQLDAARRRAGTRRNAEQAARRELMEECGLEVGPLHFCAHVDIIRREADDRIRFHYTILDFAARWVAGEPMAGSDVASAVWAPVESLEPYGLWSEAHRIIGIARRLVG